MLQLPHYATLAEHVLWRTPFSTPSHGKTLENFSPSLTLLCVARLRRLLRFTHAHGIRNGPRDIYDDDGIFHRGQASRVGVFVRVGFHSDYVLHFARFVTVGCCRGR